MLLESGDRDNGMTFTSAPETPLLMNAMVAASREVWKQMLTDRDDAYELLKDLRAPDGLLQGNRNGRQRSIRACA
jgi:hypothetical protein